MEQDIKTKHSIFLALLALAVSSFAIGTTEFVTTGLLPNLARDFHISIPMAAWVTSSYSIGVVLGAPLLTALTIHLPRKYVLIGVMLLFILGSVISALAVNFDMLLLGRVLSAFAHGAFFGVGAVVAGAIVGPKKCATAISLMFTGLTLANVLGVPLGTLLGHYFGWHVVFWIIAGLGLIGLGGVISFLPRKLTIAPTNLRKELSVFKRPTVWLALFVTAMGFSGLLTSFAYIAPMMINVTGFSANSVEWLMAIYGVGLVVGNIIGGKAADRALIPTIYTSLALLVMILLLFVLTAHFKIITVITLFLLGAIGFGTIPALQMQVMRKAEGAPTIASAANIAAFNTGVTLGVFLGGVAIHAGLGYTSVNWVGAILSAIGLALAIVSQKFGSNNFSRIFGK